VTPFSSTIIKKGHVTIGFDQKFIESIDKRYFMLPKEVGTLKKAAYYLACYIFLYARKSSKNEFSLNYETLYEYSSLPRYEEVINKYDGHITQKVIEPFLKALFQIKEKLGEHIDFEEAQFEQSNWDSFKKAKIKIKLSKLKDTVIAISKKRKASMKD
jgi:hypothetical protein